MDDIDLLENAFEYLKSDLEDLLLKCNDDERQYSIGRIHGVKLAISIVDAFIREEKQKRMLLTYKGPNS